MDADDRDRRRIERGQAAAAIAGALVLVYLIGALVLGGDGGEGRARRADGEAGERAAGDGESGPAPAEVAERAGSGTLALAGTVIDAGGAPVAGVAVIAEPEPMAARRGEAGSPVGGAAASPPGSSESAVALTDAAGAFTLRGLVAGRHRLRVEGPAVLTAEVRFVEAPQAGARILVSRRAEVRGVVTDGGAAAAGVQVRLLPLGAPASLAALTDAAGRFAFRDLPEGRFRVWAARGERAAPSQAADRVGVGPFEPVALVLGPAAIVAGRVVDGATGAGVAARVSLVPDDPDEPARTATSAADGGFRVEGVPTGHWTADAFAPGYVSAEVVRFAAGAGYAPTIALRRGGIMAGRVVDGAGAPVVGAQVIARGEEGAADVSAESVARRMGGGAGWGPTLVGPGQGGELVTATGLRFVPRGELGVVMGPLPFPPAPGATAAVRVALPRRAEDAAAAADPEPSRLPVDPALEPRFTTDRDGRFRLTGLLPGRYRVIASHPDFADGAAAPRSIDLGAVADDVVVALGGGLVVQGLVTDARGDAVAGASVEARATSGGGDPRYTVTGPDGRYRIGPLGGGVTLEVGAPGRGLAWREIAAARPGPTPTVREEDFVLVRADAVLEGRVTDPGGFAVVGARVTLADPGGRRGRPAVTDAAGRFRMTGVADGRHRVRVEHAGYPAAELDAATGAPVELRMPFGGAIEVEVRDRSGGAPIARAEIRAKGPGGVERRAATSAGRARLRPVAPGRWVVEARARGFAAGSATVEVAASARPDQAATAIVRVELSRGAVVAGVVRDQNGERVAGARVTAGEAATTTDADGRFRLLDAPSGPVTVEAEKDDRRGALELDLAPGQELVSAELRLE
jgi:protocatechuate 3,4-dioxygenase beta subunit